MSRRLSCWGAGVALISTLAASAPARAAFDADDARDAASREVESVRSAMSAFAPSAGEQPTQRTPEQLIAMGEMALRARDQGQAIDVFNQVVELFRQGKALPAAHADAAFLLAQAYFESGQLLSARRQYAELLSLAWRAPYSTYAGRSLSRLVDIAVQVGQRDTLDALARSAEHLSADSTGSVDYAQGKLSYARGRLDEAKRWLANVPANSPWYHQAQYVLGATFVQDALAGAGLGKASGSRLVIPGAAVRFELALEQFRNVVRLPPDTPEHREVITAAQLAIGRLSYESENYLEAARSFIQVGQSSPHFHDMLFELAWVYVRVGDYERAERALELLGVAAPGTLDVADGALIRADLMLRSGRFERALQAYEEVRTRFMPTHQRVERFLSSSSDPAVYYDRLVEDGLSLGGSSSLPEIVMDWAREQARDERVFALIDDVTEARDVLRRARQLSSRLGALLSAPSRTQAFPQLEATMQKALGLANQLGRARRFIALGFDDVAAGEFKGDLAAARRARRALMSRVATTPVTPQDFSSRAEQGQRRYDQLTQTLQRATLETDKVQALINGLRQVLDGSPGRGGARDAASRARVQAEVESLQRQLATYRAQIDGYREQAENGRVQIGLGDARYAEDERARRGFRDLLGREVDLLVAGQGDEDSRDYARSVEPLLAEMSALEYRLESVMRAVDTQVTEASDELSRLVAEESEHIRSYAEQLDALDESARLLVGQVAMDNFAGVRERLRGIILRADVGIVQQAWELREEQQGRLRNLQRRRAVEEQNLQNELREVVDDMGAPR